MRRDAGTNGANVRNPCNQLENQPMKDYKERSAERILLGIAALFRAIMKTSCVAVAAALAIQAAVPAQAADSVSLLTGDIRPANSIGPACGINPFSDNTGAFRDVGPSGDIGASHEEPGTTPTHGKICYIICSKKITDCSWFGFRCTTTEIPVIIPIPCSQKPPPSCPF